MEQTRSLRIAPPGLYSEMKHSTFDLIRHGEPVGGIRFRGQQNDPLSSKGWKQMHAAVNGLSGWNAVVSSPLIRCRAFAEHISEVEQIPLEMDARFSEIGFGKWEGLTAEQIARKTPDAIKRFYLNPSDHPPPGGERFADFQSRVTECWAELVKVYCGKHVLLVAHGGVIRVIIAAVLGMPSENLFRLEVANAAITRIGYTHESGNEFPRLMFHGNSPQTVSGSTGNGG